MPKAEFGTTKWMSNKIKASGLQKLRWYCQMCEKQCRDENGFKCHRMSEGHQRMMQIFIQNPTKFMDDFSQEFEREFMRLMQTRYCRTRVLANSVYNNIVADRQHIHMNSTIWVTLSEFVQYLGSTNKCKIELTPKGWYVEYIDHDERRRLEEQEKRRKVELSQEEAKARRLDELVEEAKRRGGYQQPEYTPLLRKEGDNKIVLRGLAVSAEKAGGKEDGSGGGRPANALKLLEAELKRKRRAGDVPHKETSAGRDEARDRKGGAATKLPLEAEGAPSSKKMRYPLQEAEWLRLEIERDHAEPRCAAPEERERASVEDEWGAYRRDAKNGFDGLCRRLADARRARSSVREGSCSRGDSPDHAHPGERLRRRPSESPESECGRDQGRTDQVEDLEPPPHKHRDKDWWLREGCIVKVMHEELGDGRFYKQKGKVLKVEDRYAAYVKMLESGDLIRLDQTMLETVIPNIGGSVRIVLGEWRDHEGKMDGLDTDNFCVHVVIHAGPIFKARPGLAPFVVKGLPYEHVCKVG